MNKVRSLHINQLITTCMCLKVSHVPSMYIIGKFSAFVCNGAANHVGRHSVERILIERWMGLDPNQENNALLFLARDECNTRLVKLLFGELWFSVSFLFGEEEDTGMETLALRCPAHTSISALSEALARLINAVRGKARDDGLEAVRGILGGLGRLGFELERVSNE